MASGQRGKNFYPSRSRRTAQTAAAVLSLIFSETPSNVFALSFRSGGRKAADMVSRRECPAKVFQHHTI